jgi:peptide deformylase
MSALKEAIVKKSDNVMPAIPYEIVTIPDKRLSERSLEVNEITTEIKEKLNRMLATVHAHDGIGVSGVQVGIMKRLVVIDIDGANALDGKEYEPLHGDQPLFIINPEITYTSQEKRTIQEGCLSVPDVYVDVTRPNVVEVKYLDMDGNEKVIKAEGNLLAACLQHEIDHLNGRLIIDQFSPLKRNLYLKKAEKSIKARRRKNA